MRYPVLMNKKRTLTYIITILLITILWDIVARFMGSNVLPTPLETYLKLSTEIQELYFWKHFAYSSWRLIAGLFFASIFAIPLGLFLGSNSKLDFYFQPLIYLSYPIPKIVFLPLVLVIFGLGDISKIVLIASIIFFQLLITTRDSARQIETEIIYAFKSLGGNRLQYYRHIVLPVSLPGIFTSLRIGTGIAVAVLFFVESIGTSYGLGFYIIDSWGRADYPSMFVGIIFLSLIGIILYELFEYLEKRICKWK